MSKRDQDVENPTSTTARTPDYDMEGYVKPTSSVRTDYEGTVVRSPWNKPGEKYKPAEPLGIQRSGNRDPSKLDSHLARLRRVLSSKR